MKKVGIVMGSDSDMPIINKAKVILDQFGVDYTVNIYSAHRTPDQAIEYARTAQAKNYGVLIAAAGMAAHLAGVLAANTILPVIGIPCKSSVLEGMDALLSTVQMPGGIPVATVGIDNGKNAALLALQILALEDADLAAKLTKYRQDASKAVLEKNANL